MQQNIVEDRFVLAAEVQPVIQIAARAAVVVDIIGGIIIAGRPLVGVSAIPAIGYGVAGLPLLWMWLLIIRLPLAQIVMPPLGQFRISKPSTVL